MPVREQVHPSSVIGPGVEVASDAVIGPNCYIEGRTTIGAKARLVGGVTLLGDAVIGAGCVLEPNVTMTDVGRVAGGAATPLTIGAGTCVGAGSVLAGGLVIGTNARIGAGTIVLRNVPSNAIVMGNPASIVGYAPVADQAAGDAPRPTGTPAGTSATACAVRGVRIFDFPRVRDLRGDLSVGEFGRNVPFTPKRYFLVFDVPSAETRGEHAHRSCAQFLICVSGSLSVVVDDGSRRQELILDAPNRGLYIPPGVWALQHRYSRSAVLLVFASEYYDPDDYIRDYAQFLQERSSRP